MLRGHARSHSPSHLNALGPPDLLLYPFTMNPADIEKILDAFKHDSLSKDDAAQALKNLSFEDIGYARVDHGRASRQGFPEVIFGQGKTSEQICGIFEKLIARSPNVLITRTNKDVYGDVRNIFTEAEWHESAKVIRVLRRSEG